jgi:3-carboxy-cis,cis-muconate cycloisomerase
MMTISPFDSKIFANLFSDAEVASFFSDEAAIAAMVVVEVALAKAQAQVGVIPKSAYELIAEGLKNFNPDPSDLAVDTAEHGVPVPELLHLARHAIGDEAQHYLHWGATSQDIVDTAMVVRLREVLVILEERLEAVLQAMEDLIVEHNGTLMVARTRWQQAVPTTFGYKVSLWAEPFRRHLERLSQLKPRLLCLSLGGAAGTLAALGDKAESVTAHLAEELDLHLPPTSWHTQRDVYAELAGWLSMVTGSLGKIGQDLLLLAQSEVGEVHFASSGGSSTMPQKTNPIGAEVLVALSRLNAGLAGLLHQGQIQEHERGGSGWMLEWLVLPQMITAAGAGFKHAAALFAGIEVDVVRMKANLENSNGLALAEAAVFSLSAHMPKPDAQKLVKAACLESLQTHKHLMDILAKRVDFSIDWKALKDPKRYTGMANKPK